MSIYMINRLDTKKHRPPKFVTKAPTARAHRYNQIAKAALAPTKTAPPAF